MTRAWSGHTAALLLALIALSVLLLRPVCDLYAEQTRGALATDVAAQAGFAAGHANHHGGAAPANCCASIGQDATAAMSDLPFAPERGATTAFAPVAPLYAVAALFLSRSVPASAPPLPSASFYSRSARILR